MEKTIQKPISINNIMMNYKKLFIASNECIEAEKKHL
jgi:hypothetical protein